MLGGIRRELVEWRREGAMLIISWTESGGPPVQPPSHQGFGSKLIERSVAYELDGVSRMQFRAAGLTCELQIPLASITGIVVPGRVPREETGGRILWRQPPKAG